MEDNDKTNFNLDTDRQSVYLKWRGGAKSIHAKMDFKVIDQMDAQVVFIDVGTNDLDIKRVPPQELAKEVFTAAQTILFMYPNVKRVVIMEILFRTTLGKFPCRNPRFIAEAHQYNNYMKILVGKHRASTPIRFWHHKGLVENWRHFIADGVHLTDAGMTKYYKSMRRAVIKFSTDVSREIAP